MEIKDDKGKVIDRVLSITKEGEKALEELGYKNLRNDTKTIHYLKVLLENGSPFQPEIREALTNAIKSLEKKEEE